MLPADVILAATTLLERCKAKGLMLATAESCTGGLIVGALTEIAGSSAVVDRGFVTYSNEAKHEMLGVPTATIATQGAVSAEVALGMVEGALFHSSANLAVAVTGIAGPGGATAGKPVGLVYLAVARRGAAARVERQVFPGNRTAIRKATVLRAFALLDSLIDDGD